MISMESLLHGNGETLFAAAEQPEQSLLVFFPARSNQSLAPLRHNNLFSCPLRKKKTFLIKARAN